MFSIYVTYNIPDAVEILQKKGFTVDVNDDNQSITREEMKKIFSKYDAVLSLIIDKIDEEIISHASTKLKIISNYAVGYDNIDVLAAKRKGIVVTNTPGVANESVAEHTFAFILACSKQLVEADRFMRLGKYKKWDPTLFVSPQVWGKTLGIVGLGKIGSFVGQIAYGGFRMKILYFDMQHSEDFELLTQAEYCEMDRLLKDSDIVTLHVPLTPQTHHLIGREEFKKMKKSTILVNTARGPIVDEEALVWALKTKEIVGAGLDVFEHEPYVSHELKAMHNVILTPHTASATLETRLAMAKIAAQNIIDVFEGRNPLGAI